LESKFKIGTSIMTHAEQAAVKPVYYPLTNEEWLKITQELKPAEIVVLYHLRTVTPFGDRPTPVGVRDLAKTLKMNPGTVSRALKRLDHLGYIDLELIQVKVTILTKGALFERNHGEGGSSADEDDPSEECCLETTVLSTDNTSDRYTTPAIATQHPRSPHNTRPPEAKPSKASRSSKTLKTSKNSLDSKRERETQNSNSKNLEDKSGSNGSVKIEDSQNSSDQKSTLSEWDQFSAPGRDPNFFEFVVRKTAKWPQTPADAKCAAESWIRKQGHILYPEYLEWQKGQKRAAERIHEAIPVETVPVQMVESEPMTPQKWLERYQGMWEADERSRQYIRKAIAQHPERGVCLGENGPELMAEEGRSLQGVDLSEGRSPELETFSGIAEDFSDVLAGIDVEICRLGWSASQLSAHLRQAYGKKSRQQLTDQELLNLLFCLQDEERLTG
jgi:hypothetical protein